MKVLLFLFFAKPLSEHPNHPDNADVRRLDHDTACGKIVFFLPPFFVATRNNTLNRAKTTVNHVGPRKQ